jgi:hypothetical protein
MNTRLTSRLCWLALAAVFLTTPFFPNNAASQPQVTAANANVKTAGGLTVVTFAVDRGKVIVNLPDDMRAGDTISGTVVLEPTGNTQQEKERNQSSLEGLVITLGGKAAPARQMRFTIQPEFALKPDSITAGQTQTVLITIQNGNDTYDTLKKPYPQITLPAGNLIPGLTPSGAVITPDPKITQPFIIPSLGQTGRLVEIIGPFDGNSSNTELNWTRPRSAVQDFEKNTENVSGGFGLIAESPRKAVFTAPNSVTGPMELHLTEGKTQTTSNYRNVGVNLTAPKTSLLKGESTELHVEVNGLQGITQPIPLHLTKGGVVTMQGGDVQTIRIPPSDVNAYGTYTTTRTITGVQAGAWIATATVVVFDVCLQDDKTGDRLQFNSTTGDYIFCAFPTCCSWRSRPC